MNALSPKRVIAAAALAASAVAASAGAASAAPLPSPQALSDTLTTTAPDVAQLGQVQDATGLNSATDAVGLDAVTDTARSVVPASALPDTSALNLGR
ncbi:hypothetical protein ACFU0X_20450 [Streptomyces cellulosae]|uniref:ATP-binding protein n=1 Tax=Streptomyces cellulosae TaxID=1968 RepID=A0ABW6JL12_STRCE